MLKKISFILIWGVINFSFLFAQTQEQSLFQQMNQAFRQLDYETAQKIGKQITADFKKYTPIELLEAHKILGVIAYQDGNVSEANAQFEQALSIDRTVTLDSIYVSPKIIQFFDELKLHYNSKQAIGKPDQSIHYRYMVQPDPRPAATLRSMILPGWGQLYKNDRTKGIVLVSATATITLGTAVFHFMQKDAHDEYLKAIDEKTIQQEYDKYNLFYKLRNNAALAYGGIWLFSFFDALLAEPTERKLKVSFNMSEYPRVCAQLSF